MGVTGGKNPFVAFPVGRRTGKNPYELGMDCRNFGRSSYEFMLERSGTTAPCGSKGRGEKIVRLWTARGAFDAHDRYASTHCVQWAALAKVSLVRTETAA